MDELMDALMRKYYNWDMDEWHPVETWEPEDLVDLEIMANGELQRREHERQSTH